ncbi:MAG: glycosyltransferase [Coriobacteriia bacterium]|nr:glycosyltransferase [Coriobacteriia bacterium]
MIKDDKVYIEEEAFTEFVHNNSGTQLVDENCSLLHRIDLFKVFEDSKFGTCIMIGGWCISTSGKPLKISVYQNFKPIKSCYCKIGRPDLYEIKVSNSELNEDGFNIAFPIHKLCMYKIQISDNEATVVYKYSYGKLMKLASDKINKNTDYMTWRKINAVNKKDLACQRTKKFKCNPKISIVVPLFKTNKKFLKKLIRSIEQQTYSNWELCLSEGSVDTSLQYYLKKICRHNERIKIIFSKEQLRIADNTNQAIDLITGDYVGFMDHDDELTPDALYECVRAINKKPNIDFIYTDEDKTDLRSKNFFEPHFKSDFNIDMLRSVNYFCHFVVVKKALLDKVGYLDNKYDGSQDYDFNFRCIEQANVIYHIPKVLYHWRSHSESTAEDPESKLYAFKAGERAIQAHLDRQNLPAKSEMTKWPGIYRVHYYLEDNPLVSIVIANKDHIEDLDKCINSIININNYQNFEIIIVENNSENADTFEYYDNIMDPRIKVFKWPHTGFNYPSINNYGIEKSLGDYVLLLNNDTEIINEDCISEMLSVCQRQDVGAVGAKLFYEDGTIQHAGVILGIGGVAAHTFVNEPHNSLGYFGRTVMMQDLSAVTAACMLVKRKVLDEVNYLDEKLAVAFNDIDLCMKIREKGYLIVYNPYAQLKHYESKSRGYEDSPEKLVRFKNESDYFKNKWQKTLFKCDPYYNPNLTLRETGFQLKS